MSESEIQKADPTARRTALILLLVGAAIGVVLSLNLEGWLKANGELILSRPWILCVPLTLPILIGAGWAWMFAGRIIESRRWPPAGTRVIKDTKVEEGDVAVKRGTVIRAIAVLLVIGAFALATMMWLLIETVGKQRQSDQSAESAVLDVESK